MGNDAEVAPRPEEFLQRGARVIPHLDGVVDFERLYKLYGGRVYRLCLRIVWNGAEAEDLTQEVFIQVFRKIDTFRGEAAFTTWLHRLAVNVVLMRRRKKSRIEPSRGEGTERGEQPGYARQGSADPATTLTSVDDRLDLEHAMAQLPLGCRMVLVLHDVEGYEHGEIARILGVAAGTSKSQLHKARLRLRDLLRGSGARFRKHTRGAPSITVCPKRLCQESSRKRQPVAPTTAGVSSPEAIANGQREMHH